MTSVTAPGGLGWNWRYDAVATDDPLISVSLAEPVNRLFDPSIAAYVQANPGDPCLIIEIGEGDDLVRHLVVFTERLPGKECQSDG